MRTRTFVRLYAGLFSLLGIFLLAQLGCDDGSASVSGTIVFEGREVPFGQIAFYPMGANGGTAGAPIRNGRYAITGLAPGPTRVVVVGAESPGKSYTPEEALKMKATYNARQLVTENARGNSTTVEFIPGKQTHDLDLHKPDVRPAPKNGRQQPMDPQEWLRKNRRP